ncbi:MBL fold metallo-hydrolase [Roseisolibacter sp. H3M3-2]|uniref:MBL fold metallo-hydrolase n=1 Tax=Roseisolibacter sp. H3M3-2 TaxID=3031323 RepID=UPI0023DB01B6|nr:MBL fold metallo-hydrolase [Roseisolibacter sp. H3M3-2]MDF1501409.1 MBL fold metallo-hydrolase [Roseisolibacter sp. H3M3-2]
MSAAPRRPRRLLRLLLRGVLALVVLALLGAGALWLDARAALGGRVEGARLARVERSPQWRDGAFRNRLPRVDGPAGRMLREFVFGGSEHRVPDAPIAVLRRTAADYRTPPAGGLRVTWLGHSTLLLEIDGRRVLIDPVWGERASPFSSIGPRRFFAPPLALAELPPVDAVVISHDHYDHLDLPTVRALAARGVRWLVPLGVGAHLVAWGVPDARVTELDWWEAARVGDVTVTATPARHFSGRGLDDAGATLWAGWAFAGPTRRAFYSGDTALHEEFAEIGRRLGPFDLTMIESGAYDALWADVHLGPEQAVLAHRLVRGDVMLPVHWGLFDLALHGWTEPMERVLVAARAAGVRVASPRPGGMVEPATVGAPERWWPAVPWRTVQQAPVWSSGIARP